MPRGGQTKYRPDYCRAVTNFRTLAAFGRHVAVNCTTLYRWMQAHPEFAEAVKSMNRHQPIQYQPEFCDEVVAFLKEGHSLQAFAGKIGASHPSLYDWIAKHPDFAEAVKRAQAKSALWWEKRILEFAQTGQGNAAAIIFGLKNRAAQDWRDNIHTEASGKMAPARIECVIVDPRHGELSRY